LRGKTNGNEQDPWQEMANLRLEAAGRERYSLFVVVKSGGYFALKRAPNEVSFTPGRAWQNTSASGEQVAPKIGDDVVRELHRMNGPE
jgi:hypothetical protein